MLIGHTGIRGPQMTRFVTEDSGQDDGWIRSSLTVEPGWIDYNGHMNVAFYVLAFDRATDQTNAISETLALEDGQRRVHVMRSNLK